MSEKKGSLLIVDDDQDVLDSLKILLAYEFEIVKTINNPNLIAETMRGEEFDLVLLDMNFSAGINTGNEGLFWLKRILKIDPQISVVFLTAYGDVELSVKAIKEGGFDFIMKPWKNEKLISTLKAALELRFSKHKLNILEKKHSRIIENNNRSVNPLICVSQVMQPIIKTIKKVAGTEANILICGENGTGKELIAREIHNKSKRKGEAFTSVDVGSISETLFESEFFGHLKGSFTDAKTERTGWLESANGGTLFLDEIGNIPMSIQAKLLKVLHDRQVFPVGSVKPVDIDVRLICATNKPIEKMVHDDLFREDLLYRINTIKIDIPPLRDRKDEIIAIAEYFLKQFSTKYEKPFLRISTKISDRLLNHSWPGNVRELKHSIEKAVILSENNILNPADLIQKSSSEKLSQTTNKRNLEEIEKDAIVKVLQLNHGHLAKTSKELGISRPTLNKKIKKYGI